MNNMKSIEVAVIGAGYISQFHRKGLQAAGVGIRWICDLNLERAQTAAAQCEGTRATADLQEVLADPAVEAVWVCTISRQHYPVCMAAIAAGKHVVCEKTLAISAAEAREITLAARQKGVLLFTSYMKRFFPATKKAAELLPELGEIISTSVRTFQPWGDLWTKLPENLYRPDGMSHAKYSAGGGMLPQGGSHLLDAMMFLLGRPSKVYASFKLRPGLDFDLQTEALLETPDKGIIHFTSIAHPYRNSGPMHDGWDEQIVIYGTRGHLELNYTFWDRFETVAPWVSFQDGETGNIRTWRFTPISPFAAADAAYCRWISEGTQGDMPLTTGDDVDCLIDTLIRSGSEGEALIPDWLD